MTQIKVRFPEAEHPFFTGARAALPVLESMASAPTPPRAFVVGNAGSGKSTLLRQLHGLLLRREVPVVMSDGNTDVAATPLNEVLLVDDAHLMDAESVYALLERSARPNAGLVVASRPWPRSNHLTDISRRLEHGTPAIVLGQASHRDVMCYLEEQGRTLAPCCLNHLVEITGGVPWLLSQALAAHEDGNCDPEVLHRHVVSILQEQIAHRLDVLDPPLRHLLELVSVAPHIHPTAGALGGEQADHLIAAGYAEGLLLRNGSVVPVVRTAVRSCIPAHRLLELGSVLAEGIIQAAAEGDASYPESIRALHDPRIGSALVRHADRILASDPDKAGELYHAAAQAGLDASDLAVRRSLAAWSTGDLDAATVYADSAMADDRLRDRDEVADTAAGLWAARGMMSVASEVYRALPPHGAASVARANVAHIAAGQLDRVIAEPDRSNPAGRDVPATLAVALKLLESGLRSSLEHQPDPHMLSKLVHASELYTAARTILPIPELPAVIAAAVAVGAGDLATARFTLDAAVAGGQGGHRGRRRLLLWQAWVAIQNESPGEARNALALSEHPAMPRFPRDEMLHQSVVVTLARRYDDTSALAATWRAHMDSVRHLEVDLFTLLPLSSLIAATARIGDSATLSPQFTHGLQLLQGLGSPPLWSTHLRWAGIQQGILLNRPESLEPHARALVSATGQNHVAKLMAEAGGVWVAVLAGNVDADAVEAAARALASVGLAWDGARLASHGAKKSKDRKVAARLLACGRELHPPDTTSRAAPTPQDEQSAAQLPPGQAVQLSERELDVARLVLEGKTYVEIGQAIFISPRTVEHHIAHMRRRLGASSRSDLMAKLRAALQSSPRNSAATEPQGRSAGKTPSPTREASGESPDALS